MQNRLSIKNLYSSWYLVCSALFFWLLNAEQSLIYAIGTVVSSAVIAGFLCCFDFKNYRKKSRGFVWQAVCVCSTFGTCTACYYQYYLKWYYSDLLQMLGEKGLVIVGGVAMVLSIPFVFVITTLVIDSIISTLEGTKFIKDTRGIEWGGLLLVTLVCCILVTVVYLRTNAFYGYGSPHKYDIIYTSDTPFLVTQNAFVCVNHPENDLKQVLFGFFSAPLLGTAYLIGKVFSYFGAILCMEYIQIFLLIFSCYLLARTMELTCYERLLFVVVNVGSYTFLLFTLNMEQYVVSFFWITLFLYSCFESKKNESFVGYGAVGTLSTNIILYPLATFNINDLKASVIKLWRWGISFLFLLLGCNRLHLLVGTFKSAKEFANYSGSGTELVERCNQFFCFVRGMFFAPAAQGVELADGKMNWQLLRSDSICVCGVMLFSLVLISGIINRKDRFCRLAMYWVLFSFIFLCLVGWGTSENGLILYALYFQWAYMVLLYRLVERTLLKLNFRQGLYIVMPLFAVFLLCINVPEVLTMVRWAFIYYPK